MVILNIGDNRQVWSQSQEHVIVLVGFDDEVVALTGPAVAIQNRQVGANDDSRIQAGIEHDLGDHACGRRLAMGASNGNAIGSLH